MDWHAWQPFYAQIVEQFGYDVKKDQAAAATLSRHISPRNHFQEVSFLLHQREHTLVVGCGPHLEQYHDPERFRSYTIVAADGATSRLRELDIVPHVVVTDLDGNHEDLIWAAEQGSFMVVHAHSENAAMIDELVPKLGNKVFGTYQSPHDPQLQPLQNFGGFTDGDRAVILCEHLEIPHVALSCFDFDSEPSKYSHKWDPKTKAAKLHWARRLIADVHQRGRTMVEFQTA